MWHLIHSCPMLAQEFPLIHFLLHLGHLYSPKHLFFPWYGVSPSPLGRAWEAQSNGAGEWQSSRHRLNPKTYFFFKMEPSASAVSVDGFESIKIVFTAFNQSTNQHSLIKSQCAFDSQGRLTSKKAMNGDSMYMYIWAGCREESAWC